MRVKIDGGKYEICSDAAGRVWIERGGESWIRNPEGAKMLLSIAYELACLRQIAAEAVPLAALADHPAFGLKMRSVPTLAAQLDNLNKLCKQLDGITDYRRHLDDPGEV